MDVQAPGRDAALALWLAKAQRLRAWLDTQPGAPPDARQTLAQAQWVLQAMGRGEPVLPQALPGEPAPRGAVRDARPAALSLLREHRDAVLRLGLWDALHQAAGAAADDLPFSHWASGLLRDPADVPPGLAPTLDYAGSPHAAGFFNLHLRALLRRLAPRFAPVQTELLALADLPDFDASGVAVHRWSRAWTLAVCAVYADWLRASSDNRLSQAAGSLWRHGGKRALVRFRAPPGLAALPSRSRSIHLHLWASPVLAEVLASDPARWQGTPEPWHKVALAMHDLGARDTHVGGRQYHTQYHGLSVEMVYQAVFLDRVASQAQDMAPSAPAPTGATHKVDLPMPALAPGQQARLRLLLEWQVCGQGPVKRGAAPAQRPELNPQQQQWLAAWQQRQEASPAVAWQPAAARATPRTQPLCLLGRAQLWAATGAAEWMSLALQVQHRDRRLQLPLQADDDPAAPSWTRLWLPRTALRDADLGAAALQRALGNPACTRWHRQAQGLGCEWVLTVDLAAAS